MKRWVTLLVLLTIALSSSVQAQDEKPPLLVMLYQNNTVFAYQDGEITPLTFCAPPDEAFAVTNLWPSPDGQRFAFLTASARPTSAANNVRICDLKTRRLFAVTGQPQTANVHSTPAWSPDGSQLAFVRLVSAENQLELVLYDSSKGNQAVLQTWSVDDTISLPPQIVWTPLGIIIFNSNAGGQTQPDVSEYILYPQEFVATGEKDKGVTQQLDRYYDSIQSVIGQDATTHSLVLSTYNESDQLFDLATQEVTHLPGSLVKVSTLTPEVGSAQSILGYAGNEWIINGPDYSAALNIPATTPESITVSADGTQFAFVTFENYPYGGKLYLIDDPAAFAGSFGSPGNLQGVRHVTEFDGFYGQPGAIAVFWGPSTMALHE